MTPPRATPDLTPEPTPFNPLDYENLTKNVVDELMRRGPFGLPLHARFKGAGVYALFYVGDDSEYATVRSADASQPIYVGKAVPAGARKGLIESNPTIGTELYKRLSEHTESIGAAADLSHDDFLCRYLVVEPLWIVMAEQFLITRFRPLWNLHLDGFGNHNPGSGRHQGEISWWDARHPGRPWAVNLQQTRTKEQAVARIREFYSLLESGSEILETEAEEAAEREAQSDD